MLQAMKAVVASTVLSVRLGSIHDDNAIGQTDNNRGKRMMRFCGKGTKGLLIIGVMLLCSIMSPLSASANEELIRLSKSDRNWVMQTKDYTVQRFSKLDQIDTSNVKNLQPAWSFSTGVLHGHEGGPLVVNGIMYVHSAYPNNVYAIDLEHPEKIMWEYRPKQNPAARAVACCDLVNRGLAYGDGKIILSTLDGQLIAMDAKTGKVIWNVETADVSVGQTQTQAPFVVKDKVIIGSAGAELGVRGYVTAFNIKDGKKVWRAFATGPDQDLLLDKDFNKHNPHYGRFGLGLKTWEGDAWKIGGGTNWGWYAYDPKLDLIYYGSGNPAPWNETMRPGDNKWTMTMWGRNPDTGLAKYGYQKTPHDEWDYAGINYMMLTDQVINGKITPLVTHPDRNGIIYTLNRETGSLVAADKIDPSVNWTRKVDLKTGIPIRDPEFSTRMDHKARGICPSAMGYHNQGLDSYDPRSEIFFMGVNHICMDWEPFMLPYRAGQFFVGATLSMYPGPKGYLGEVKAYDVKTNSMKWEKAEKFSVWGGTMATAGNLVFYGTLDGWFKALDSGSGEELWKFKLPSGVIGHPITYEHNGKQYVAILYGVGGWPGVGLVFDLNDPTAGLGSVGAFKELAKYTKMGGGLMVFALPEGR